MKDEAPIGLDLPNSEAVSQVPGLVKSRNPVDEFESITECSVCATVNQRATLCPDGQYNNEECAENYDEPNHDVPLYKLILLSEERMKIIVAESILDSVVSQTVSYEKKR